MGSARLLLFSFFGACAVGAGGHAQSLAGDHGDQSRSCHTNPFRGMTQPGGTSATMRVGADTQPCLVRVWTRLDPMTPYESLSVTEPPHHGSTTTGGSTFAYQPQRGFVGTDDFTVTGTGFTARGTPVTGVVHVTVEITPHRQ